MFLFGKKKKGEKDIAQIAAQQAQQSRQMQQRGQVQNAKPAKKKKKSVKISILWKWLEKIKLNQYWFKPRTSFIRKGKPGVPFRPITWEGWLTLFIFFLLFVFFIVYFRIWKLETNKIIAFIISLVLWSLLYILVAKNSTKHVKPKKSIKKLLRRFPIRQASVKPSVMRKSSQGHQANKPINLRANQNRPLK